MNLGEMKWRNVWCAKLRPGDLDGRAPAAYQRAEAGDERKPGIYGEGFAGEALVCLLPDDAGDWFVRLACNGGQACRHTA